MTIAIGDRIPDVELRHMVRKRPEALRSGDVLGKGKVVLFAVPGAFTPTCSDYHLPGFVHRAEDLRAKGVDTIACISVNDPFVMGAWGKEHNCGDDIVMLGDGSGEFTRAIGLELDRRKEGMGMRSQRYSMLVDNGVVKALHVEEPGVFEVSSAEAMLKAL